MNKVKVVVLLGLLVLTYTVRSGNPDRIGESGAEELRINPWARSAGLFGMNSSRVEGIESMRINVAGLTFGPKTELAFSRTNWLQGSQTFINAFGFSQKFGKDNENAIGFSMMAMDFGDIPVTTTSSPDLGTNFVTFSPSFFNIGFGFARAFSKSVRAGALVRIISERIPDVKAFGFAIDLGIQYVTGPLDNVRFGVSLRNVGTPMTFGGNGLAFTGAAPNPPGADFQMTQSQRAQKFELPSLLNIGLSYDLYADNLKNDKDQPALHRISIMANFTANSFGNDYFGGGLEYSWRELFAIRSAYRWEDGITGAENTSSFTGFSAGFSAQLPLKKDGPSIAIDYAFRTTRSIFSGTHNYGIRLNIGAGNSSIKRNRKIKKKRAEETSEDS